MAHACLPQYQAITGSYSGSSLQISQHVSRAGDGQLRTRGAQNCTLSNLANQVAMVNQARVLVDAARP